MDTVYSPHGEFELTRDKQIVARCNAVVHLYEMNSSWKAFRRAIDIFIEMSIGGGRCILHAVTNSKQFYAVNDSEKWKIGFQLFLMWAFLAGKRFQRKWAMDKSVWKPSQYTLYCRLRSWFTEWKLANRHHTGFVDNSIELRLIFWEHFADYCHNKTLHIDKRGMKRQFHPISNGHQ